MAPSTPPLVSRVSGEHRWTTSADAGDASIPKLCFNASTVVRGKPGGAWPRSKRGCLHVHGDWRGRRPLGGIVAGSHGKLTVTVTNASAVTSRSVKPLSQSVKAGSSYSLLRRSASHKIWQFLPVSAAHTPPSNSHLHPNSTPKMEWAPCSNHLCSACRGSDCCRCDGGLRHRHCRRVHGGSLRRGRSNGGSGLGCRGRRRRYHRGIGYWGCQHRRQLYHDWHVCNRRDARRLGHAAG
jgi:hypothetical protein